jgi:hypothetical protein
VVVLPDGTKAEVPAWMTEEEAKRGTEVVEQPSVSINALLALKRLLDGLAE